MAALFGPAREFEVQGVKLRIALETHDRTTYGSVYKPVLQEQTSETEWTTVEEYSPIWKDIPEQMSSTSYSEGMLRKFNTYLVNRFPAGDVKPDTEVDTSVSQMVFAFANDVFLYIQKVTWNGTQLVYS